jgi:hypothetical protein
MIEKVLGKDEKAVAPDAGEGLVCRGLNVPEWIPTAVGEELSETMWMNAGVDALKDDILLRAANLGATLVLWRIPPCPDPPGAYAIVAMWRPGSPANAPANNDGRSICFWCGESTTKSQGFTSTYDICPKCGR